MARFWFVLASFWLVFGSLLHIFSLWAKIWLCVGKANIKNIQEYNNNNNNAWLTLYILNICKTEPTTISILGWKLSRLF